MKEDTINKERADIMIRQEIKTYMNKNKDAMGFSHLEIWFTHKYQGVSQKECKRLLKEEYDHSLLYDELEEHFGQLTDKEKSYAKNIFITEVLSKLIFEGASVWLDSNLKEHKKSIE